MKKLRYTQLKKEGYAPVPPIALRLKSAFGTFLIVLAGLCLFLDKIFVHFNITLDNLYGWPDTESFVWVLCQTISPILILIAAFLRPYLFGVVVPAFCYALQLLFIFNAEMSLDNKMIWLYVGGSVLLVVVVTYAVRKRLEDLKLLQNIEYQNLEDENAALKRKLEELKNKAA